MNINYKLIGSKIRYYRELKGLSQEELAFRVDATERHLRNVEYGLKGVSVSLLISLANSLDITANDLLTDFLTASKNSENAEFLAILNGTNTTERAILMDMLKHMKVLIQEYGI